MACSDDELSVGCSGRTHAPRSPPAVRGRLCSGSHGCRACSLPSHLCFSRFSTSRACACKDGCSRALERARPGVSPRRIPLSWVTSPLIVAALGQPDEHRTGPVGCSLWSAFPQIYLLASFPPSGASVVPPLPRSPCSLTIRHTGGPHPWMLVMWLLGDGAQLVGMYIHGALETQKLSAIWFAVGDMCVDPCRS